MFFYPRLQGNSSESPVPSTSESSTPSARRPTSQTPARSHPHVSYSPLVCHTQPRVGEDEAEAGDEEEEEQGSPETMRRGRPSWKGQQAGASGEWRGEAGRHHHHHHSPPRRYPSEPFLASQEDDHSPDASGPMETLTFEAAVAHSLGRSNTVTAAHSRSRSGWQIPNGGHFRKRMGQAASVAAGDALSDTEEEDRC